ncbi:MAG: aminotransferase class I/II-fold pyridoxal phosphate-dependent enzyme [bacterium]|nr:aminotransferase class I/II-fold pyridoxal phosphate-dependent enzyme [bacterium]
MKKIRILKIPPSATVAINSVALDKARAGETIYNLSAGEPMMPAPAVAVRAFTKAFREGKTHYPSVAGIGDLREEAALWMNRRYGSGITKENTLVTSGGKLGIFFLLQALLQPGDEVLIPAPYWVSYPGMVRLFRGLPKIITTSEKAGWKITPEDIKKNKTKKTKILILNNAGNPTGALYSKAEIKKIMSAATRLGLFIISDEVYSGLVYGKTFASCAVPGKLPVNLAIIESCSKSFAMTGFRLGFVFTSPEIIKTLSGLATQSTSGATTMCQYAALPVLKNAASITKKINIEMKKRRDLFVSELNKTFEANIPKPSAGLYVFVPLKTLGWHGKNSEKFCKLAIEVGGVATVPGSAFGKEGYVRFSFGERPEVLITGIRALAQFLKKRGL